MKIKARNKKVYGVGINDSDYITNKIIDGRRVQCFFYKKWYGVLKRSYCAEYKKDSPTYKDCTVCDEWLVFSVFKSWMESQDWAGKEIDKDLLVPGNKHYSPETCIFLDKKINTLIRSVPKKKSGYPRGVTWHKEHLKFRAMCREPGAKVLIGYYDDIDDAELAYLRFKYNVIHKAASTQPCIIKDALLNNYAAPLLSRVALLEKGL